MSNHTTKVIFAVLTLAVAVTIAMLFLPEEEESIAHTPPSPLVKVSEKKSAPEPREIPEVPTPEPDEMAAIIAGEKPEEADLDPSDDPEPVHYYNGMNPEDQPRAFFDMSFQGLDAFPPGFEITGNDIRLSDAGFTLAPPAPGEEDLPRSGMVESPPYSLDFLSNAMNPMWKESSPDGTEVLVEISLSPDGEYWTDWFPTTGAHTAGDIEPYFPDGRPNPNYGYERGSMVFYGLEQFEFFRFAVTMYSESGASPVVSDFRMFYQDSTMGEGALAQVPNESEGPQTQ